MVKNQTRIEIKLVERVGGPGGRVNFPRTVRVWGGEKNTLTKDTLNLRITYDLGIGGIMRDVTINKHCGAIVELTVFNKKRPHGSTRHYTLEDSSQCEACVDLLQIFDNPNFTHMRERQIVSIAGPRRIEINLQGAGAPSSQQHRLVLVDLSTPTQARPFYTLYGKTITGISLSRTAVEHESAHYFPRRVVEIATGRNGRMTRTYARHEKDKAWKELTAMYETFTEVERTKFRNWTGPSILHEPDDDDYAYGGYSYTGVHSNHWTQGGKRFQAEKAHYRVAGDERGAILFRKQESRGALLTPSESRDAVLKEKIDVEPEETAQDIDPPPTIH